MSHIKRRLTIVAGLLLLAFSDVGVAQNAMPTVSKEWKDKASAVSDIPIPKDIEEKVKGLMETLNSEQWQNNFKQMKGNVATMLGTDDNAIVERATGKKRAQEEVVGHRLYVFISQSVPMRTLRNYARDVEKLPGAVMVLRGFVAGGHKITPTAKFVADIIKQDAFCEGPSCAKRNVEVQIDPYLFRRFSINSVPAVAFETNVEGIGYCGKETDTAPAGRSNNVVYGDASLHYALEELYALGKEQALLPVIQLLEPKV